MKQLLTIMFFLTSLGLNAQNQMLQDIANDVDMQFVQQQIFNLCGYDSVEIDGQMELIESRHKNRPGNELAYQYLSEQVSDLGYTAIKDSFSTSGKNLLAMKTGMKYPNQYVMICAHYDGMPVGPIGPAADDNASSCIAVLQAMKTFEDVDFEYSILFAFWDEEEQGLVGAESYAEASAAAGDSLLMVLNMDAIAYDSDDDYVARVHVTPSLPATASFADSLLEMNTSLSLGLDLIVVSPGATYSDHAAFWDESIPALLLIEDWDNDSNPGYHTNNDDTSYFNWPYYEQMIKLSVTGVASWAKPIMEIEDTTSSIRNILEANLVSATPNPTENLLTITAEKEGTSITFYNIVGDVIALKTIYGKTATFEFKDQPTGVYYYIAEHDGFRQRGEFIKK